jgi:hypothetical protein
VELPRRMVRRNMSSDQSPVQVVGKYSNLEGATTVTEDATGLETNLGGGSFRSTFLAKREC